MHGVEANVGAIDTRDRQDTLPAKITTWGDGEDCIGGVKQGYALYLCFCVYIMYQ